MIQKNISLKPYNTFGIEVSAGRFLELESPGRLALYPEGFEPEDTLILGGGSNLLFVDAPKQLVIFPNFKGIEIVEHDEESCLVKVAAGEDWDEFVSWTVENEFYGAENLSAIPGNVGACPIQNIGAYGVEVKDIIEKVNAIEIRTLKETTFSIADCCFGYRDSIFKRKLKGQFLISEVFFRLSKTPKFKLDYGDVKQEVENLGGASLRNVRDAIVKIRESKLPNPKELGNAGSFFKNPIVEEAVLAKIKTTHPEVRFFDVGNGNYKIPAAWLIDQCGLKGHEMGNAAVYKNQPLVLVNKGAASGKEILDLANFVIKKVKETFGVELTPEVNIIKY